ncbi:FAD-dependent oxidoreductase, partial [Mycobacterium celatum]
MPAETAPSATKWQKSRAQCSLDAVTAGSLAVIGGGVIGLSVARRAAEAGLSVRVHRTGDHGASWVAAGML